ncbi:transcription intermediary factor 1-beta isoform X3 [Scleropages formosus]|uniref:transcription intermediary factor 1-beta isoform X3 n=1 Tax=Scleropages formosus TaxID=113540 RepID=UPI0010FAA97E|nr:transcription intermediary factor 1-beta-like isoform X3 [Scleropages formosus]
MWTQDGRPEEVQARDGGSRSSQEDPSTCPASPAAPVSFGDCGACGAALRPETSPQLLPCLHSLCRACTFPPACPAAGEGTRECPLCKRSYALLEVTDNPFLKYSASSSGTQEVSKCSGCEEFAISGWCVQCGEALCSVCVSAHQRVRVTRDHTVLPQKLPTNTTPTLFCRTHKEEPVKLFCKSCNQLTCRDCQLTFHRNHSYQFLHEALTSQREQIESLLARLRQQKNMVKESLLDLNGRLLDLTVMKSRLKDELQETLVRMRYVLMKRSVKLFKDVQDLCGREAERVTERQAILRRLRERQEHVLSFTEKALATGNHFALLSSKRQIQFQLEDILSQNVFPAASVMDLKFHFDQDLCNRITRFGKIITEEVPFARSDAHINPNQTLDRPFQTQGHNVSKPLGSRNYTSISVAFPPSPTQCQADPSQITPISVCSVPTSFQQPPFTSSYANVTFHPSSALPATPHFIQSSPSSHVSPGPPLRSFQYHTRPYRAKNCKTWSFHNYQPKKPRLALRPVCPVLPDGLQFVESQPSAASPLIILKSVSSPVRLYPVTPPPIVIALDPPTTSILDGNTETITTCAVQAITQTLSTQVHNAVPTEPWHLDLAIESVKSLSDISLRREEQPLKSPSGFLPVKALADSPCERAAAAGCGRKLDRDRQTHAAENEPTSTVTETENVFPAEVPDTEAIVPERLQVQEHVTMSANGAVSTIGPTMQRAQSQPCTEQDSISQTDSNDPHDITTRNTDSKKSNEKELPHDGLPVLVAGQTPEAKTTKMPISIEKLLERPENTTSQVSSDEDEKRSVYKPSMSVSSTEGASFNGNMFPRVSVLQLPISLPTPGQPLPQFRLLPGSTKHKVFLEVIDGDHQVSTAVKTYGQSAARHPKTNCAVCRTPGQLQLCARCGRGFHRDCHIPPLSSTSCSEWKCLLCQDLSEDEDPYSTERERRPSLSLPDQKKCEYLLLALMCNPHSTVLFHTVKLSSHYIDSNLIRGRLLRKQSPSYRTPSEFVSDIWVLLDTLLEISEETKMVAKLQRFFQKELSKTFGKSLHPSLLKCPVSRFVGSTDDEEMEASRKRVKSKEESVQFSPDVPVKKHCQDGGSGTGSNN